MRRLLVPLLAALSAPAFCQVIDGNMIIGGQMQALATNPAMYLDLSGTDTIGVNNTTGFEYRAWLQVSLVGTRAYDLVSITAYNGSGALAQPVMSLIGDGVTLWRYDYLHNTYSAANYGNYSGDQPIDYTSTLFRYLTSMSDGYMSYPILFLRQTYGVSGASYQPWIPGNPPAVDGNNDVTYTVGAPPRRTIYFSNLGGVLNNVAYEDYSSIRGVTKHSQWAMTVQGLTTTNPNLYVFTPPAGAKPIAGPRLPGH